MQGPRLPRTCEAWSPPGAPHRGGGLPISEPGLNADLWTNQNYIYAGPITPLCPHEDTRIGSIPIRPPPRTEVAAQISVQPEAVR